MKKQIAMTLVGTVLLTAGIEKAQEKNLIDALPAPIVDADYYEHGNASSAKVKLGQMLFFDKVLSGNQNISCATCHHPETGTGDALALPLGEGAKGLGKDRKPGSDKDTAVHERVPRNSPALWNLGAAEFTRMFHDGRVEVDSMGYYASGFISPARWKLPEGLDNVLAAQAMFPVTSPAEMAGQKGENGIAEATSLNNAAGNGGVWQQISERLQAIPEYVALFRAAYPDHVQEASDITFVLAANAIASFESQTFRADNSPFDEYLRGDRNSMSKQARQGMALFYGKAKCSSCHSGKFMTDQQFHAIGMPQVGPGKSDGWNQDYWRATGLRAFPEDFGRGRVTTKGDDKYKFRTPSLRNVALNAPYGHAGAYASLEEVIRHHLDAQKCLDEYSLPADLLVPLGPVLELSAKGSRLDSEWLSDNRLDGFMKRDGWVQQHPELREQIAKAIELQPIALSDAEIKLLVAFLENLTDPSSLELSHVVPERVPSGLPVED